MRHGAHVLTASRNVPAPIGADLPPPATSTFEPALRAEEIRAPSGHTPAADRNVARSLNGIGTRQWEVGDAASSRSTTGRRYGRGGVPKTRAVPEGGPVAGE